MTTKNSDNHKRFIQRWAQIKWAAVVLLVFGVVGFLGTAQQSENGPLGDYGDAPDALRAAYDHVDPKIIGAFPATYNAPFDPSFVLHRFPKDRVFLGQDVTQENNALEVDRDLDDGWTPGSFLTCSVVELQVFVTIPVAATAGPLYLNSLFDWNHDGRWADFTNCDSKRGEITTAEWAIQNLRLDQEPYNLKPGFSGTISLPKILTGSLIGEMWIRFTITTEKVDEDFFKPVGLGGRGWNGQGDFIFGETEDYFNCLLANRESIFAGCPAPLSNQPPLDPPPGQTGDNNTPNAVDDSATTTVGSPITISVLANDTDPNNDKLTVTEVTQPSNGTVTINANGTVTYTPKAGFSGTDTFTYKICDPGNLCDTATVTVQVTSPNQPPVANNDTATTTSGAPVVITVTSNDSDPEHEALLVIGLTLPTHGNATLNPDGTITYTSNSGFSGVDSFTYTVCDPHGLCSTATVTVTVNTAPVTNSPPDAINDSISTNEDTPVTIDVKANDSDPDSDVITVISLTQPSHGTATLNANNTVTYTPDANYNGNDSFTYTISDGHGGFDTATVIITINPVNDAPVANDDSTSTPEDTPVIVSVLSNDTDVDGDTLTISGNTNPTHGIVTCTSITCTYTPDANYNGNDSFTYTISDGHGGSDTATVNITISAVAHTPVANDDAASTDEDTPVTINVPSNDSDADNNLSLGSVTITSAPAHGTTSVNSSTGAVTYTPDANYNGSDSFVYQICDTTSLCDTAAVTITIDPVNDAPVANDDSTSTPEDTPVTVSVLSNDTDADGDTLTVSGNTNPTHGTVTCSSTTCTYTPDANYNGNDSFTYTISDGHGGSDTATVTITIDPVNDDPVANDDSTSTPEDTPVTVSVLSNDTDADGDTLIISGNTTPSHGSVTCTITCTYTPDANYNGSDSFTYTISDGHGGSDTATVTITIDPVNDDPVAESQLVTTSEDTPVSITLACTDVDGDALSFILVSDPAHGTLSGTAPNLTYTPSSNYNGNDSFTFKCNDGQANSNTAAVTITVNPVNDPPVADANGPYQCTVGETITLSSAGSYDPDGTILQYAWDLDNNGSYETLGANPQFQCSSTGVFVVALLVTDNEGAVSIAPANATVTVIGANNPPQADNLLVTTDKNTAVSGSLPVSDPDHDPLTCTLIQQAAHGTAVVNADCTYTYTPNTDFTGQDEFQYQVSDGQATDTGLVLITIISGWDKSSLSFVGSSSSCDSNTVSATVKNNGSNMAGSTTWELYYSASGDPKSSGTLVASGTIPALTADHTYTMSANVTLNGNYMFRALQRPGHPGQGELWSDSMTFNCH